MTTAMTTNGSTPPLPITIEKVLIQGNLAELKPEERVAYYNRVCESLGLNPLTGPFDYLNFQGKLKLYAKRDATDQLRRIYNVSVRVTNREVIDGVLTVTAVATLPDGREDEDIGALTVAGLKGDALALATMKATTKAKRRVTLSICGLGWLDESEVEDEPRAEEPAPRRTKKTLATIKANAALPPATAKEFDAAAKEIAETTPPPSETPIAKAAEVERQPGADSEEDAGGPPTADELIAKIGEIEHQKHAENWRAKHRLDVEALDDAGQRRVAKAFYDKWPALKTKA